MVGVGGAGRGREGRVLGQWVRQLLVSAGDDGRPSASPSPPLNQCITTEENQSIMYMRPV